MIVVIRESEFLKNNVSTIISAVYTSGKNTPNSFAERLRYAGFTEVSRVADTNAGHTVMVFEKSA